VLINGGGSVHEKSAPALVRDIGQATVRTAEILHVERRRDLMLLQYFCPFTIEAEKARLVEE
jgi:hypothetical protein